MGFLKAKFSPSQDLVELKGKVVIVTGGNKGIGYSTVKHLAARGAQVYMGARDEAKATQAIKELKAEPGLEDSLVVFLKLDLLDLASVKAAAKEFLEAETRLDILVNNASLLFTDYTKTHHGVMDQMMTNHFGPFLFTRELLPLLIQTAKEKNSDVRIVTLSSFSHKAVTGEVKFATIDDFSPKCTGAPMPSVARYNYTKLANMLSVKELQRRLDKDDIPITVMAIHPGQVNTYSDALPLPTISKAVMGLFLKSPESGSYNSLFAAASPKVKEDPAKYRGAYLEPVGILAEASKKAQSVELAKELWGSTENFLESLQM